MAGLILVLLLAGGWLFWPVSPPEYSLLALLPEDMVAGVELRSPASLWEDARQDELAGKLLDSPFGARLKVVLADRGVNAAERVEALVRKIDRALARPGGTGLVGRSLNGSVAIGGKDGEDGVILARLDNLGAILLRLALWTQGQSSQNLPAHLVRTSGAHTLYITTACGLVVAATSAERLAGVLAGLQKKMNRPELGGVAVFPEKAVVLMLRPNAAFSAAVKRRLKVGVTSIKESVAVLTRDKSRWRAECWGLVDPLLMERAWTQAEAVRQRRPEFDLRRPALGKPERAWAWCRGWLAPEFAWKAFSKKLWDEDARPRRGGSRPLTVLVWEALDQGVIAQADGRLLLALGPVLSPADDQAVPPVPEMLAAWGVEQPEAAAAALAAGVRPVVEFYRAPGGHPLYQAVREETRLETVAKNGRQVTLLHLQPLFFNHLQPGWATYDKVMTLTSAAPRLGPPGLETAGPGAPPPTANAALIARLEAGWRVETSALAAWRAVIADKVVRHALVADAEKQRRVMQGVDLLLALWRTFGAGRVTVRVRRESDSAPARYPFRVDAEVSLLDG